MIIFGPVIKVKRYPFSELHLKWSRQLHVKIACINMGNNNPYLAPSDFHTNNSMLSHDFPFILMVICFCAIGETAALLFHVIEILCVLIGFVYKN